MARSTIPEPTYGLILKLAWPAAIAASVTPLLAIVDVWALGRSDRPLDIAAVGLAATIFSLTYWTFGFIRMSVAGLTAQAAGADDFQEVRLGLIRALTLGGAIGLVMVLLQTPLGAVAFHLLGLGSAATDMTFAEARQYFDIRIWGAPFALATYACFGWLTARGRTDFLMLTAIMMTLMNCVLNLYFVLSLKQGAAGIALGTLLAEVSGFFLSLALVWQVARKDPAGGKGLLLPALFNGPAIIRMLGVNRDIFIRTLLLAFSFAWFVQRGSIFGDVTLAANQVLLQLFLLSGLALDGTAIAAETLVGQTLGLRKKRVGGNDVRARFMVIVRRSFALATLAALAFMALYLLFGTELLRRLVPDENVFTEAVRYWGWVIISPLMVMVCFQLDGIFVGATHARDMRNSMILATGIFIPLSLWLPRMMGNHGLWLGFSIYFLARAVGLMIAMPALIQRFRRLTPKN
ncbi:MAG: MATE family efflux transporter [Pseudomonadota bacterium]